MAETIRYGIEIEDKGTPKLVGLRKEFERTGAAGSKAGKQMSDGLKSAADRIPGLSSAMGAFAGGPMVAAASGAAVLGAGFVGLVSKSVSFADKINDLSLRLGISTERLSRMSVFAEQSGTSIDSVASAMGKLSVKLAANDKDLRALGITTNDAEQAFFQLADIIAQTENPTERAAIANAAFGKSWQDLMPLLVQGGDELRKMSANAPVVTKSMAQMADAFGDKIAEMKGALMGIGLGIAEVILPQLQAWLDGVDRIRKAMGMLTGEESRVAGRNKLIEQYSVAMRSSRTRSVDGITRIKGKSLSEALAEYDKANARPETPAAAAPVVADVKGFLRGLDKGGGKKPKAEETTSIQTAEDPAGVEAMRVVEGRVRAERKWAEERERIAEETAEKIKRIEADAADATAAKWNSAANSVSSAFSTAFSQTLNDGRNLFAGLADSFKQMLLQMVADMAARAATFMIFDAITGGNAGGTLGGSKGPMSFGDFVFGGGRASGGPMQGGRSYLVGERGPEWITMGGAGRATPAASQNISITVNAAGGDGKSIANEVTRALREAGRRRLAGIR